MSAIASNRTTSLFTIVAIGIVAVALGFLVREPVERALFVRAVSQATGFEIAIDRLDRDGQAYVLQNLRANVPGGAGSLVAAQARVLVADRAIAVALVSPTMTFDPDRYRDADRSRTHDAFAGYRGGVATVSVTVDRGTLAIARGPSTLLDFEAISGTVDVDAARVAYGLTAQLVVGDSRYPITGAERVRDDGTRVQTWTAARMPLAPFDAFVAPNGPFHARAGTLDDLAIEDGAILHARAHVVGGRFALGTHELRGVHGALVADAGGIGSHVLVGTLDGKPFDAAGEVHDFHAHYRWLRDGSNDLTSLATLATTMASEPRVNAIHLEVTAPGLVYGQYAMTGDHGPLAITMLGIDPREPTLRIGTTIAENHVVSGGERTSAMGLRTHAVGGVNGDYFDIGRTYQPQGMLVKDGALVRGPTDRAALAISDAKHVTFAEFHLHGTVRTARGSMPITEFNDWPSGQVAVITPDYGKELPAKVGMTFVRLEPLGVGSTKFRVDAVEPATHALAIGFGIGVGRDVKTPLPHVGETIDVSYATEPSIAHATTAIGGGPILLRDGTAYDDAHAPAPDEKEYRWPVIALARERDDRLLLVAVDGRHPERSVGMTRPEFSDFLLRLGATDAMALDSGGSVTLVSRAPGNANVTVRNVPSDHSAERWVSDALFVYSDAPKPTIVAPIAAATPIPEARPTP